MFRCNQLWSFSSLAFGLGVLVGSLCHSALVNTVLALGAIFLGIYTLRIRK